MSGPAPGRLIVASLLSSFALIAGTFNYSSLLSGPGPTLSASVQSFSTDGTVVVNGVDAAQLSAPFAFSWGDGSSTSGFFPQQHIYADAGRNYVITVTANESTGATPQVAFPVFFIGPSLTPQTLPGVSFLIPSQPVQLSTHGTSGVAPPSGETVFSDSAFPIYTRAGMQYLLSCAAAIDQDLANGNVYLLNGVFAIDMLENLSFGGGYSFYYTTPMSVGYGLPVVTPPIQWFVLFNEIGKDTTLNTPVTLPFGDNTAGSASEIYSETMGWIFSYATGYELINNAAAYGISDAVALDLGNSMLIGAEGNSKANFDIYVASGAPFSSWNPYNGGPDPTLGMLNTLAWKFIEHAEQQKLGYRTPTKRLMTLLQLFSPSMLVSYDPHNNTQSGATFRSTLMVTALSYAFSEDLRSEFRALNFPIDDAVYTQLYSQAAVVTAGQPPSLSLSTGQTDFTYTSGGAAPVPQPVSISNPGGGTLTWSGSSNSSWLSATLSGTAPSALTISVTPASLTPGSYRGVITVTAAGAANSPKTISVSLTVNAAPAGLLTIQTNPAGLQFSLDGGALQTAPQTFSLPTGSTHTVAVAPIQAGPAGTRYSFTSWSDLGTASHSILVSSSATLTATFATQYQLTITAFPSAGGSVSPASGGFYNSGSVVNVTASANAGYSFTAWTGAVANSTAAFTTVTMSSPQTVTANFNTANGPTVNSGGIVPLYSSTPVIQPGSWISIWGTNLANTTAVWNGDFPTSLGGISVTIDNKPGYLWYVSAGQITLQAPDDAATGLVPVVVTTPDGTVTSTVTLAQSGPSFSLFDSRYVAGVIPTPDGSGVYGGGTYDLPGPSGYFSFNARPARVGEVVEFYGVGFGPTNPAIAAGKAFSGAAPTLQAVTVTIGGVPATVQFSGLTSAGLYQLNVVVPNVASGDQLLQASVAGGARTPAGVYINVQ